MIRKTLWKPDTCGCEMEFNWDDAVDTSFRTHTLSRVIAKCSFHSKLTAAKAWAAVNRENVLKNTVYRKILETVPTARDTLVQDDGAEVWSLKDSKEYRWAFDATRTLKVTLAGFTAAEKAQVISIAPVGVVIL